MWEKTKTPFDRLKSRRPPPQLLILRAYDFQRAIRIDHRRRKRRPSSHPKKFVPRQTLGGSAAVTSDYDGLVHRDRENSDSD